MPTSRSGFDFQSLVSDASAGVVLRPILRTYLHDAVFPPEFSVTFKKHKMQRDPDRWFHPSTHPMFTARMLYFYRTEPEKIITEVIESMGTLSITVGHAMHSFIQMCLEDQGVLLGSEVYVEDKETQTRGHMDGVLNIDVPNSFEPEPIFEFKTTNMNRLSTLEDLNVEQFKLKFPGYYAQQQEYMRLSGKRLSVVLMMAMGYPWDMREFHLPYHEGFANGVADKYREVLRAEAEGWVPEECCGIGSKQAEVCPARAVCPVGLASS